MRLRAVAAILALVGACAFDAGGSGTSDPLLADADPTAPDADPATLDAIPGGPDAAQQGLDSGMFDAAGCPAGYSAAPTGSSCYRTVTAGTDWDSAEADCEDDAAGAHLVVVEDAAENSALPSNIWIGLSEKATAGVFLWATGAPESFTAYASGQPAAGGGLCVEARPDGWHDDICAEAKDYVCEFDGVSADPSAY